MMSFIVDYKGDIPGSLFMAAQTYADAALVIF